VFLSYKISAVLAGLIWGIVVAIGYTLMSDAILQDLRMQNPDSVVWNSEWMVILIKAVVPLMVVTLGTILVGPFFQGLRDWFLSNNEIMGLEPRTAYVVLVLVLSILLDAIVVVTNTSYPWEKIALNTWTFIVLGLALVLI
jgi:hypothetical protein